MEYKIYRIGHALQSSPMTDEHNAAFKELGVPITFEVLDVPPVNFHREISELTRDPSFLGAKLTLPYKQTALAYCQEISHTAKSTGVVNTLVRRPSGLVYGHNTDVRAFTDAMHELGVTTVRSALVMGAGEAARLALAGLREIGCARYLVGYRNPRRPTELSSQFKGIRRQMNYFPLQEMTAFFGWAAETKVFPPRPTVPPPNFPIRPAKNTKDGIKRWGVLVNATPVGQAGEDGPSLVDNANFLRSFDMVVDLVPVEGQTKLATLARDAEVPVLNGYRIFELQAQFSREIWLKEYERRNGGGGGDEPSKKSRKPVIRRQKRG